MIIPNIWENKNIFQTTNQIYFDFRYDQHRGQEQSPKLVMVFIQLSDAHPNHRGVPPFRPSAGTASRCLKLSPRSNHRLMQGLKLTTLWQ